jgi:hypothetical protein
LVLKKNHEPVWIAFAFARRWGCVYSLTIV